jgi:hypothetical protein
MESSGALHKKLLQTALTTSEAAPSGAVAVERFFQDSVHSLRGIESMLQQILFKTFAGDEKPTAANVLITNQAMRTRTMCHYRGSKPCGTNARLNMRCAYRWIMSNKESTQQTHDLPGRSLATAPNSVVQTGV